ncbi:class I SAM-dependent methyltransferase [Chloroflexota bacterium]
MEENKRQVQKNFGRQALAYNANCLLADEDNLNNIIKMAKISEDDSVLDVATGTGFLAGALSEVAREVMATDLTLEMLYQTRPKTQSNTSFCLADVEKLPFHNDSFDVVTCRVALHHFTRPDEAFNEIRRVCRPNGRVVIMDIISSEDHACGDYHNVMERLRDSSHVKQYSYSEMEQMFKESGLKVVEAKMWEYAWGMEEWLEIASPAEANASEIRRMMYESVDGDKSGLSVEVRDGVVYFTYMAAIVLAICI